MNTIHPQADILIAIAQGKDIQVQDSQGNWADCTPNKALYFITNQTGHVLRVKPEVKSCWIVIDTSSTLPPAFWVFITKQELDGFLADAPKTVKITVIKEVTYSEGEGL